MQLAPNHEYLMTDAEGGVAIVLRNKENGREFRFFCAGDQSEARIERLASHMESLTDDLCSQWTQEQLTPEQRKAKQKADKEAKRKAAEEARQQQEQQQQ